MRLSVQWAKDGVRCTYAPSVTLNDIQEASASLVATAPAMHFQYLIHDFTAAEKIVSGVAALLMYLTNSTAVNKGISFVKVAIVSDDADFKYLVDQHKHRTTSVAAAFDTLQQAEQWIGV